VLVDGLQLGRAARACVRWVAAGLQQGHRITVITFAGVQQDAYSLPARATRLVLGPASPPSPASPNQADAGAWPRLPTLWQRAWELRRELQDFDVVLSVGQTPGLCLALAGWGGRTACVGNWDGQAAALPRWLSRPLARQFDGVWDLAAPATSGTSPVVNGWESGLGAVLLQAISKRRARQRGATKYSARRPHPESHHDHKHGRWLHAGNP
jgi:hypothetical protein